MVAAGVAITLTVAAAADTALAVAAAVDVTLTAAAAADITDAPAMPVCSGGLSSFGGQPAFLFAVLTGNRVSPVTGRFHMQFV